MKKEDRHNEQDNKGKRPFYQRWWFIAIVAFFLIGGIGNLMDGNGDGEDQSPKQSISAEDDTAKDAGTADANDLERSNDTEPMDSSNLPQDTSHDVPPETPVKQPAPAVQDQEPVAQVPVTQEPVTQEPIAQEPIAQEPIAQEPVAQEPVTQEPVQDTRNIPNEENYHGHVYATPNGKRYHYEADCGGKNSVEITWDTVDNRGLTPCGTCVLK